MSEISERILKALLPKPLCRDCADNDGRCPHDGELCNPEERAKELHGKLVALQQIRDELLEALKQISDRDCFDPPTLDKLIRDAQALKE